MSELERFIDYVRSRWGAEGACNSCGWHGLVSEHWEIDLPDAEDIANGYITLCCVSKDHDDADLHRGVRIYLDGWKP